MNNLKLELNKISKENIDNLKQTLEWKYENINASKIESKTSVSKIKSQQNETSGNTINMNTPKFLKEEEKITNTRKGTIVHLCMQKLNIDKEYTKEKIKDLLEKLVIENKITMQEKETVNIEPIYQFTKSSIWKELKNAKQVEKEKPFYINIPAKEIYKENIEENILVQGIIDLYYINEKNELILVDYKTDYVQNEKELIEKYKIQLQIYKKALEQALNKKVDKVYIYSTYLNKPVGVRP